MVKLANRLVIPFVIVLLASCSAASAGHVIQGPANVVLVKNCARLDVPNGYAFGDRAFARRWSANAGVEPEPELIGLISPTNDDTMAIEIHYDEGGFIHDDVPLDTVITAMNRAAPPDVPFHYVRWTVLERNTNRHFIICKLYPNAGVPQFRAFLFGRRGFVDMICLDKTGWIESRAVADFRVILSNTSFDPGYRYEDFVPGRDEKVKF
jgi:uncharacterized membrane-anchored protein